MNVFSSLFFISTFVLVILVELSIAAPPLKNGQKWVANPNCTKGGVYKTNGNTIRCHCWGHQGYICEPADNRKPSGDRPNNNGGGGNKCPPTATVCVINNNSNTNSNQNSNQNKNQNDNASKNGKSDYDNYD